MDFDKLYDKFREWDDNNDTIKLIHGNHKTQEEMSKVVEYYSKELEIPESQKFQPPAVPNPQLVSTNETTAKEGKMVDTMTKMFEALTLKISALEGKLPATSEQDGGNRGANPRPQQPRSGGPRGQNNAGVRAAEGRPFKCYYCGDEGHVRGTCSIFAQDVTSGYCHERDGRVYYGKEGPGAREAPFYPDTPQREVVLRWREGTTGTTMGGVQSLAVEAFDDESDFEDFMEVEALAEVASARVEEPKKEKKD